MLWGIAAGLLAAVLFGVASVAQAGAARRTPQLDSLLGFVSHAVRDPVMLAVVAAYLGGFVLHAVSIWLVPLYLAQATISLQMPVTSLLARSRLGEDLSRADWAAVVGLSVGLLLLAAGSGQAGSPTPTTGFALGVWAAAVAVTVVALLTRGGVGAWLGTLSGLGYAGSAIAVRGVDTPLDLVAVATAAAVPVLGLVAFWVYSLGMGRASVTAATGPLIVTQTFVPAAVGIGALGDGVRAWPLMTGGLLLATAGAVVLSRGRAARPSEVAPSR